MTRLPARPARAGALAAALLLALAFPAGAYAHAVLEGTDPPAGQTIKTQPALVEFRFSEPVEANFGAVRVYDREGRQVERGEAFHPGGEGSRLATRLAADLPDGTYTATYRVISADSHPVSGGSVFSVGRPGATGATVSELLDRRGGTGDVTALFFGIVRSVQYGATALAIGTIFFLVAIWLPALASVAGAGDEWRRSSERFAARLRSLLALAVGAGIASGILGVVCQGATAAGVTVWSAFDPEIVRDVLDTRFGTVWGLRVLAWIGFAVALAVTLRGAHSTALRPASVGAAGLAMSGPGPARLALLALPLGLLAVAPALAGHAGLQDPTAVLLPANVVHVLAMSVWSAGLVLLLFALPGATRELAPGDRARLLAANLVRFSTAAGIAVAALIVTGALQAWFEVAGWGRLLDTAFGRAVLIKSLLLLGPLVALAAHNRLVLLPRLRRIAADGEPPGAAGALLRRALILEVVLICAALGVTSALVSYPPPESLAVAGPVAETVSLGPADLQVTVDPARAGPNAMHFYLTDKRDGTQYDDAKEFSVSASLPGRDLGPVPIDTRKAGPGHWVANGATFSPAGEWRLQARARVSEFDAYYAEVAVPIE